MSLLLYAIVGLVVIIIAGLVIVIYNSLVALRNNAKKAWADIDVLLEKRHDALGKLIDTVSSYMKYEKGLMMQLTQLRSQWMNLPQGDVQAKMNASNQVSSALKSVLAVAENYPDLKANNSFIQLQQSIQTFESQIADRREFYNQSVTDLNIRIQQFPYNLLARAMGFSAMTLFQVPEETKADVKINFDMHQ
jgi:LemA protein